MISIAGNKLKNSILNDNLNSVKYQSTKHPIETTSNLLYETIISNLSEKKRILFLVSGGSNIAVFKEIVKKLKKQKISLDNLYISLMDERFGAVGHKDENFQHFIDEKIDLDNLNIYHILRFDELNPIKTARLFNDWLDNQFQAADIVIGLFGIGIDGHTAGIKPHTIATKEKNQLAFYYIGPDFPRITISFKTIRQVDLAVIQASGKEKQLALKNLINNSKIKLDDEPAQIFNKIQDSLIITDAL